MGVLRRLPRLAKMLAMDDPTKPTTTVNVHEAKTRLSQLLAQVEAGEEVVIARNGEPVARLVPAKKKGRRQPGTLAGKGYVDDSFFDPLPEEELRLWEGG